MKSTKKKSGEISVMLYNVILLIVMLTSMLALSAAAQAGSLIEYERFDTRDVIRGSEQIEVVLYSGGSRPKNFWSDYDGLAIIKLKVTREDGTSYTKSTNVWFDEQQEANDFVAAMNANPRLNLMYDFHNNPLNTKSTTETCNPIIPFMCQGGEATIVVRHQIDGNRLWINDPDTDTVKKVSQYVSDQEEAREHASLGEFDGGRDEGREQDNGLDQSVQDQHSAIAV